MVYFYIENLKGKRKIEGTQKIKRIAASINSLIKSEKNFHLFIKIL